MEDKNKSRQLIGMVSSDKMNATAVVLVDTVKVHPKYHKRYKITKKYVAHNEGNAYHTGDKVVIQEIRPMSRTKRWKIVSKVN
jgi:small subunit ribosomal protein S17